MDLGAAIGDPPLIGRRLSSERPLFRCAWYPLGAGRSHRYTLLVKRPSGFPSMPSRPPGSRQDMCWVTEHMFAWRPGFYAQHRTAGEVDGYKARQGKHERTSRWLWETVMWRMRPPQSQGSPCTKSIAVVGRPEVQSCASPPEQRRARLAVRRLVLSGGRGGADVGGSGAELGRARPRSAAAVSWPQRSAETRVLAQTHLSGPAVGEAWLGGVLRGVLWSYPPEHSRGRWPRSRGSSCASG